MSNIRQSSIDPKYLTNRAVLPLFILLDLTLSANEIRLYGIVEQLESTRNDVFYSNRTLSGYLGLDPDSGMLKRIARSLVEKGYLKKQFREVIINGKAVLKMCWNTVKNRLIIDDLDPLGGVQDVPPKPDLTQVSKVPGGGVPEVPWGGVPGVPPNIYKEDINILNTNTNTITGNPEIVDKSHSSEKTVFVNVSTPSFSSKDENVVTPKIADYNLQKLSFAYEAYPVVTSKIKNVRDFIDSAIFNITTRENNYTEDERVHGIIKFLKLGKYFEPKGWRVTEMKSKPSSQRFEIPESDKSAIGDYLQVVRQINPDVKKKMMLAFFQHPGSYEHAEYLYNHYKALESEFMRSNNTKPFAKEHKNIASLLEHGKSQGYI